MVTIAAVRRLIPSSPAVTAATAVRGHNFIEPLLEPISKLPLTEEWVTIYYGMQPENRREAIWKIAFSDNGINSALKPFAPQGDWRKDEVISEWALDLISALIELFTSKMLSKPKTTPQVEISEELLVVPATILEIELEPTTLEDVVESVPAEEEPTVADVQIPAVAEETFDQMFSKILSDKDVRYWYGFARNGNRDLVAKLRAFLEKYPVGNPSKIIKLFKKIDPKTTLVRLEEIAPLSTREIAYIQKLGGTTDTLTTYFRIAKAHQAILTAGGTYVFDSKTRLFPSLDPDRKELEPLPSVSVGCQIVIQLPGLEPVRGWHYKGNPF
jgi:hypothetical protein